MREISQLKIFGLELVKVAEEIGRNIARVKKAAREAGIPVIYINDNFGKWKSDFRTVIKSVIKENKPGRVRRDFPLFIQWLSFQEKD